MVELASTDCSLPRNIHDNDSFHENCTELPKALPDTEQTQVGFLLAKSRLAFGFARALKEISSTETLQRERVLDIDRELRQIYNNIPAYCKLGPLSDKDSLTLVSFRFVLASIHHKSLCVLHSRFLERGKSDYRYLYSRRVCLSSAMSILRFQAIQNLDIPVDGGLRSLTNYQTSLAIHDYLLAATILSAELCSNTSAESLASHKESQGLPTRTEMIKALNTSARIFSQMGDQSMEAYKAADVLQMLLKKIERDLQGTVQNPKDVQQPGQSSRVKATGSMSHGVLSQQQTLHRVLSNASDMTSPSTNLDTAESVERTFPRYAQHDMRGSSRPSPSLSTDTGGPFPKRPRPWEQMDLDGLANWPPSEEANFCNESPQFPQISPDFDPSCGWMVPERTFSSVSNHYNLADVPMSVNEGPPKLPVSDGSNIASDPLAAGNPPSLSAAFSLSDPMSTLWNLTSGTQLDFGMV